MDSTLNKNPSCFVMQVFDKGGDYDQRYKDIISPALEEAGVTPCRADEILGLQPIINKIETEIKKASVCLADVSEDNPNVWLELGYALALGRPTVIICNESARQNLPFDIRHRPVIFYKTGSPSYFQQLKQDIINEVKHALNAGKKISEANVEHEPNIGKRVPEIPILKPELKSSSDLEPHAVDALTIIFTLSVRLLDGVSSQRLHDEMSDAREHSYTKTALAIHTLSGKNFIEPHKVEGGNPYDGYYSEMYYQITTEGKEWVVNNQHLLQMEMRQQKMPQKKIDLFKDEDIPF